MSLLQEQRQAERTKKIITTPRNPTIIIPIGASQGQAEQKELAILATTIFKNVTPQP